MSLYQLQTDCPESYFIEATSIEDAIEVWIQNDRNYSDRADAVDSIESISLVDTSPVLRRIDKPADS